MASTIFEGECVSGENHGGGGFSRWECKKCGFSDEEITRETLKVCPRCGNELTKILVRTGGAVPVKTDEIIR